MLFNLNSGTRVDTAEDVRGPKGNANINVGTNASLVLAANPNRAAYSIYNAGSTTAFLAEGSTVSSTLYEYALPSNFYWKEDFPATCRYLGPVYAISPAGTVTLRVSEAIILL